MLSEQICAYADKLDIQKANKRSLQITTQHSRYHSINQSTDQSIYTCIFWDSPGTLTDENHKFNIH